MAEFDISKSIHTLKYGLYVFAASIPAMILAGIVTVFMGDVMVKAFSGDSLEAGLVMMLISILLLVFTYSLSFIQVICFCVNEAVNDANLAGYESIGYGGSWKAAFNITTELAVLMIGIIVIMILGVYMEMFALMAISGIMLWLMYMGLIPYIIRRTVEA